MKLQFEPPTMKLKFNKFKFDKYVNENVFLPLHLRRDVEIELEEARYKSLLEFGREHQADTITSDGIRLGMDFVESPITLEQFHYCKINKQQLDDCIARACAAIELGVSRLIVHFADDYVNGNKREEVLPRICLAGPICELRNLCMDINKGIRSEMFSAFNLGKTDGFEDGMSMMMTILGKNPSDSCWFPFLKPEDKQWVEQKDDPEANTAFARVPVKVHHRTERTDMFRNRLASAMKFVALTEAVMQNLLICRLRFFLAGKKQEPVNMDSFNQMESSLRNRLETAIDHIYKLGHSTGFESGQISAKSIYFKSYSDCKFYTLTTNEKSKWVVVDTTLSTSCDCEYCAFCIRNKTTTHLKQQWEDNLNMVAKEMKSIARQLKDKQLDLTKH